MDAEQPNTSAPAAPREPLLARLRALPVDRRRRLSLALSAGVTVAVAVAVAVYRALTADAADPSFLDSVSAAAAVFGERFSGIIPPQS